MQEKTVKFCAGEVLHIKQRLEKFTLDEVLYELAVKTTRERITIVRDELEEQLDAIRRERESFDEYTYGHAIEPLLIELALIYESAEARAVTTQP